MGADMDPCVVPCHEFAVHPDLLGLTHARPPLSKCYVWLETASIGSARESRIRSVGASAAKCLVEPAPIQTSGCPRRERSRKTASTCLRVKGATALGSEPRAFRPGPA